MKTRLCLLCACLLGAHAARAVMFASTSDIAFNTTAPGGSYAGSGWQYQGRWMGFLGTPIAPQYFITAEHVSGGPGDTFTYGGQTYVTDAVYNDPNSDLRILHVTTPFSTYATLYTAANEVGKELVVFGRGTQRGVQVTTRGWEWGAADNVQRWGTNEVSGVFAGPAGYGQWLQATFDLGASANEATLSIGDSGGGVFIRDSDGVWKLAGINVDVTGPYKFNLSDSSSFNAALHDQSGLFAQQWDGLFAPAAGSGSFFATRISSNLPFIWQVTGIPEPSPATATVAGAMLLALRARRR